MSFNLLIILDFKKMWLGLTSRLSVMTKIIRPIKCAQKIPLYPRFPPTFIGPTVHSINLKKKLLFSYF